VSTTTVLLVDENVLLIKSLSRCFARRGCVVRTALSCAEAEASVGPFDCGVFDVELGSGDGIALAERLLRAEKVRSVVFYTGSADAGALRRASAVAPIVLKESLLNELAEAVSVQVAEVRRGSTPPPRT
jgi:CheY-like chemotaxis protein